MSEHNAKNGPMRDKTMTASIPSSTANDAAANLAALESSLAKMMAGTLFTLNVLSDTPTSLSAMQAQLDAQFQRWLKASVTTLVEHQLVQQSSVEADSAATPSSVYSTNAQPVVYSALFTASDVQQWQQEWQTQQTHWLQDAQLAGQIHLLNKTLAALPDILQGKILATDILFAQSSVDQVGDVYKEGLGVDQFNQLMADMMTAFIDERLEQASTQNIPMQPIRLLEIGAGTGGTSRVLLDALTPYKEYIAEYCYTDISLAFMMHAEKEFQPHHPFLVPRLFNVEKSPESQGVELGQYDMVVATNVLHATSNIRNTLRNAKAVMRNGGWILINEMSLGGGLIMHLTFGLLKGWWLYEDEELRIPGSPALLPQTWAKVLEDEGFNSAFFPAEEAHEHGTQVIVAQSDGVICQQREIAPLDTHEAVASVNHSSVIEPSPSVQQQPLPTELADSPIIAPAPVAAVSEEHLLDHVRQLIRESICESLNMEEGDIIDSRSFSDYGIDSIVGVNVVNLINQRCDLLLQTTVLFDYTNVNLLTAHIVEEHSDVISVQVSGAESVEHTPQVASELPSPSQPTPIVASVFSNQPHQANAPELAVSANAPELSVSANTPELSVSANTPELSVSANAPELAVSANTPEITASAVSATAAPAMLHHIGENELLKVQLAGPGALDQLQFVTCPQQALQPQEVRVATRAFALNFGDLLCVKGLYPTMPPYPFTPGFELAGEVLEVGSDVEQFTVGDRVIASMGENLGGNASMVVCHFAQLFKIPPTLSYAQASALPSAAITMIAAFHRADLMPGETILIQTAAGGTGLIAVQLAKHYQATVIATAGSAQKLAYLREQGVEHLINYRDQDFEQEVQRITEGRGVDVVINTLSGDAIQKGMNCLADGGRYIEIAMTAIKSARNIDLSVLSDNQAFFSIDLRKLSFSQPQRMLRYRDEMWGLVEQGVIQPTICKTFGFEQLHDAYRCMEDRQNIGKIVVAVNAHGQPALTTAAQISQQASAVGKPSRTPDIAVIGMSCRYANTDSPQAFWSHLAKGNNLVSPVNRWDLPALMGLTAAEGDSSELGICTQGSLLEAIDQFDPNFFNISGLEARYMDPQQRLFLEESWKALEDAGYAGDAMRASACGVYVGCANGDYQSLFRGPAPAQAFWGNAGSVIPARIAYYLNLHGPALAIDTACSSSLVALHVACQALWNDEIHMAIAGGVHLQASPGFFMSAGKGGMLSPNGRCFTFDHRADGFVPGEGVAALIVKTVDNAIADGDHIYGVIAGSGINQDGETNGITAPSAISQERLERSVYDRFNINPRHIGLMEAHGTGTKLGDPIEFNALTKAFSHYTTDTEYCALGSVKTNLGHSSNAAGLTGVIKVLLALQHQQLPPSLNYEQANPAINFDKSPFFLNEQLSDWLPIKNKQGQPLPRMGAVSSFGFSGTNAHVVLKEFKESVAAESAVKTEKPAYLLVFSAVTEPQLQQVIADYLRFFKQQEALSLELSLGNLSYTLLMGRRHGKYRLTCVVKHVEQLQNQLEKWLNTGKASQVQTAKLTDNDVREKASLKRYANQSIIDSLTAADATLYQDHLSVVADFYLQGYALDYAKLFCRPDGKTRANFTRLSLPTYPFAKESYWADTVGMSDFTTSDSTPALPAQHNAANQLGSTPSTTEKAKLSVASQGGVEAAPILPVAPKVLAKAATPAASISLSSNLSPLPTPAVSGLSNTVIKGVHGYQETYFPKALPINAPVKVDSSQQTWLWILSSLDAYEQLVSQFSPKFANLSVLVIFKFGTIDPVAMPENARAVKEEELGGLLSKVLPDTQNLRGIIFDWECEQTHADYSYKALWDVTRVATLYAPNLHHLVVTGKYKDDDISRCYYEAMLGFVRSLSLLLPNCTVQHVLHAYEHTPAEAYQWGQQLFEEVRFGQHNGVLYRGEQRLVVDCVADAVPQSDKLLLQNGGCYVITGGMGGLGLLFARYLAEEFAAKLILIGRSSLSAEQEAQLHSLSQSAASVEYVQGDIANAEKLAPKLHKAISNVGQVDGVIHAAGTQVKRNLLEKDYRECRQVLLPKIEGTLALDQLLHQQPLKFVCYFSSSSAILGDFGMGDYGLANRFQMAYARYREQQQLPGHTLCINWPLWKDGGMNFDDADAKDFYLKSSGQKALTDADGIAAFSALMSSSATQVLLLAGNKKKLIQHVASAGSFVRSGKADAQEAQQTAKIHAAVSERLIADIKQQISQQLEISIDKLDEDENLAEFGFDSILLTDFAKQLSAHLGIAFSPAELFNYPTISKLSGFLLVNFTEQLQHIFWHDAGENRGKGKATLDASSGALKLVSMPAAQPNVATATEIRREPIAIIGMAGRFPQARNVDALWQQLAQGECAVREIPRGRFDCTELFMPYDTAKEEAYTPGTLSSKWSGLVPGVDEFDCSFFEVSPREAQTMDPRQRLLLQEAWHALEDAGYGKTHISQQRIGMFVGVEQGDYQFIAGGSAPITANHEGILAARLSYFLDLNGPTLALNTACSSGLVAAHQACLNLWMDECDAALAAGVNCLLTPGPMIGMSHAGMLSPQGKCSAFGHDADGLVPAEAVAVMMLKRLSKAQADGDPIHAVIAASGINYDGKTNGITAPNGESQKALLREVYQRNGIDVDQLGLIIAHGTGTKLGDPIEVNALSSVLSELSSQSPKKPHCALYSTKANLGHSFAASGLVSLLSVVSAIKHQQLPPSIHASPANEHIHWQDSPLYVNSENAPWTVENAQARMGAVSAFGMSGTNAHMVVQEYTPPVLTASSAAPAHLLVLSAKKAEALQKQASQLAQYVQNNVDNAEFDLNALSHTLLCGRFAFAHRLALVVRSPAEAQQQLHQFAQGAAPSQVVSAELPKKVADKGAGVVGNKGALQSYGEQLITQADAVTQSHDDYEQNLHGLAELFIQGYQLDWAQLFSENQPRIHAPSYPFIAQRHWATPPPQSAVEASSTEAATLKATASTAAPSNTIQSNTVASGHANNAQPERTPTTIEPVQIQTQQAQAKASLTEHAMPTFAAQRHRNTPMTLTPLCEFANVSVNANTSVNHVNKASTSKVQLSVMPTAAAHSTPLATSAQPNPVKSMPSQAASTQPASAPALAASNAGLPLPALKQALRTSLADMLFAEEADVAFDAQFIDLGLDSIVGVEWIRLLNKTYHLQLSAADLYDHACLNALARFIQPIMGNATALLSEAHNSDSASNYSTTNHTAANHSTSNHSTSNHSTNHHVTVGKVHTAEADELDALLQQVAAGELELSQAETALTQQLDESATFAASAPVQAETPIHDQRPSPVAMVTFKQLGSATNSETANAVISRPVPPAYTPSAAEHVPQATSLPIAMPKIREQVVTSLAEALFMQPNEIVLDATFTELGVDSIIGVEWVGTLNKLFAIKVKATDLYAYATVKALVEFIQTQLVGQGAQTVNAPQMASVTQAQPSLTTVVAPSDNASSLHNLALDAVLSKAIPSNATSSQTASLKIAVKPFLRESLADALFMQVEEVADDAPFIELGLDSIIGVEWLTAINREFQLKLTISELYDYSCISALAPRITHLITANSVYLTSATTDSTLDAVLQNVSAGDLDVNNALALLNEQ